MYRMHFAQMISGLSVNSPNFQKMLRLGFGVWQKFEPSKTDLECQRGQIAEIGQVWMQNYYDTFQVMYRLQQPHQSCNDYSVNLGLHEQGSESVNTKFSNIPTLKQKLA